MKTKKENNCREEKKILRLAMKEKRSRLTQEEVSALSEMLCQKIYTLPAYQNTDCILAYFPIRNEVSLLPLIKDAVSKGKRVYLPKVAGERMIFLRCQSQQDVAKGYMGIYEPVTTEAWSPEYTDKTIALLPGLAFDASGNRLGYGGGFYDRFLTENQVLNIGICYDFQILSEPVPTEPFDITLQYIVSEKRIINTVAERNII